MKTDWVSKKNRDFQRKMVWSPEDNEMGDED